MELLRVWAQREVLQSLGCEYVQGYLLSPPLDAEAAERLMVANRAVQAAARTSGELSGLNDPR